MIFSSRNIVCTPSFQLGGGGGVEQKKGLEGALFFGGGLVGKRRDLFFGGGPIFT